MTAKSVKISLLSLFFLISPCLVKSIHLENNIINGQAAVSYPHHVYIGYSNAAGGGFFGGGSIITPTHVLTVAQNVRNFVSWNIGYGANRFSQLQWTQTSTAIPHPNFNVDSRENDIAVLVVSQPFVWSATLQPVSLPPATQVLPLDNEQGTIVGFGWTSSTNSERSDELRKAFVRIVPDAQCQNVIAVSFPNHFCAFDSFVPANFCHGDVGGGFLTNYRGNLLLVGMNSILLEGCGSVWPSAYTRISPYLGWIESVTGGV